MKTSNNLITPAWLLMLVAFLLIFAIGLDGVMRYTIRRDELTTLGHIGALEEKPQGVPFTYILGSLEKYSPEHPPLFYFLIRIFGEWMEFHYYALRILSVWFTMIAVAGLYWLGKRLDSPETGFWTAVLFGTNVMVYSVFHEMRPWAMSIMLMVLIWALYWHIAHKRSVIRWYQLLALFLLIVSALYTNYTIMFLLIPMGLYHLIALPKNKHGLQITGTVMAAGLAFVPWLPVFMHSIGDKQIQQTEHLETASVMIEPLNLVPLFTQFIANGSVLIFILFVALGFLAIRYKRQQGITILFFVVLMIGLFLGIHSIFLFVKRLRYVVILAVPFSLLAAFGLSIFYRWRLLRFVPLLLAGIWMLAGYQFIDMDIYNQQLSKDRPLQYPEYNYLVPILRDVTEKRDLVVIAHYRFSAIQESKQELRGIHQYYMDDLKLTLSNLPLYVQWSKSGIDATPVEYATGLIPQYDDFWFSFHHTRIEPEIVEFQTVVEENYTVCETIDYGYRSRLIHYVRTEKLAELCPSP